MPGRPISIHRRPVAWPDLLADFVEAHRTLPFVWGGQDCMTFACDGAVTLIGVDPIADKRGAWSTEAEADAITEAEGGFEAMMAARMTAAGLPECDPRFAQRGDIALVEVANQLTAGLVIGTSVAVTGPDRLQMVPRRMMRRAWVV
jgi:hypothetical protein